MTLEKACELVIKKVKFKNTIFLNASRIKSGYVIGAKDIEMEKGIGVLVTDEGMIANFISSRCFPEWASHEDISLPESILRRNEEVRKKFKAKKIKTE